MRVPMLDLKAQHARVGERIAAVVAEVVQSQSFILGPVVQRFEDAAAEYLGAKHAIGVSSGSDALVVALLALGVGPGQEVITTPFSFFATVEGILRVGAVPRLVDIDEADYALNPDKLAAAISGQTAAILVAHLFGRPARIREITQIAADRGVPLVEDAAQAFGASFAGKRLGTFGTLGCFSFHPSKPLGAWGDAGLVVSDDPALAERCRSIRAHGATGKHQHARLGGNYRLDALQAAVLLEKLKVLDSWLNARRTHSEAYDCELRDVPKITIAESRPDDEPSAALYTIRLRDGHRDALKIFLADKGIETAIHYPLPFHLQPALLGRVKHDLLPEAERATREVLSLPLYPELSATMRDFVIRSIKEYFRPIQSAGVAAPELVGLEETRLPLASV